MNRTYRIHRIYCDFLLLDIQVNAILIHVTNEHHQDSLIYIPLFHYNLTKKGDLPRMRENIKMTLNENYAKYII